MRKYFTRRCVGLHALVLILVPGFLYAGWWQFQVARSGNDLSWVYTVEWPFFALYATYIWWKLIHDESTPFDRLWAAKQRAAADEEGKPIHQIPGWAMDKSLSRAVADASKGVTSRPALSGRGPLALEQPTPKTVARPAVSELDAGGPDSASGPRHPPGDGMGDPSGAHGSLVDARVLEVREIVDPESAELDAYNRYLFELSRKDPPKRWGLSRTASHSDEAPQEKPDGTPA